MAGETDAADEKNATGRDPRNVPLVSVIMTCFQHAKYIGEAISSILLQTFSDFELIVVDDGSNDGTREAIHAYPDPRITYLFQPNAGPSAAFNSGFARARGELLAVMSGDDVCELGWLASQVNHLMSCGLDASFCLPTLIDNSGCKLGPETVHVYFSHDIKNSASALNYFFWHGNALLAPGALINRDIFMQVGPFEKSLFQLQDFDLWIRLAKAGKIKVLGENLIRYRIRDAGANLGSDRHLSRIDAEHRVVYRHFFDDIPPSLLETAFPEETATWFLPSDADGVKEFGWCLMLQHSNPNVRQSAWNQMAEEFRRSRATEIRLGPYRISTVALANAAMVV